MKKIITIGMIVAVIAGCGEVHEKSTINVELSKALEDKLTKTVSKPLPQGLSVYFISQESQKLKLISKAINEDDQEFGRCIVEVEFADDDAKYIEFKFGGEFDIHLVKKYIIDIKE